MGKKKSDYIHGYSKTEQNRLYSQAKLLEQSVYRDVDFSHGKRILEVGSGVGAQTKILLRRFPHLQIDAIDASDSQINKAKIYLKQEVKKKSVRIQKANAQKLPFADNTFDGAFVCWFLEHLSDPISVLREIHRVLKPGGVIYCSEVLNATLFIHPYSPATLQYWFQFNDLQWTNHGDPFVGAKLGNLLMGAGYRDIFTKAHAEHFDNRTPKQRAECVEDWKNLMLSGAPALIESGRVNQKLVDQMKKEFEQIAHGTDSAFFNCWIQARAFAL